MIASLLGFCILLEVAREVCFKWASQLELVNALTIAGFETPLSTARAGWIGGGIVFWSLEFLLWAKLLSYVALNIAFPIMSLTYAATPLAAKLIFGEKISKRRWTGIVLITLGSGLVAMSGHL